MLSKGCDTRTKRGLQVAYVVLDQLLTSISTKTALLTASAVGSCQVSCEATHQQQGQQYPEHQSDHYKDEQLEAGQPQCTQQQQVSISACAQQQQQFSSGIVTSLHQLLWPAQQPQLLQCQCHKQPAQQQMLLLLHARHPHPWSAPLQHQLQHSLQPAVLSGSYHRATHAPRVLTTKLLQQKSWQELRMLFDASGGGARLNPIQLCALIQHLARLAPAPELLAAHEHTQLRGFADELSAACLRKLHRLDAVGLAAFISSALKLGCNLQHQQQQQQPSQQEPGASPLQQPTPPAASSSSSSSSSSPTTTQLLTAATKQVAYANSHGIGMLMAAMTSLQQQQVQQQGHWPSELSAWHGLAAAAVQRLTACAAVHQLSCVEASKLCLTVSRLMGIMARQRAAATAAAAARHHQHQHPQQEQQEPGLCDVPDDDGLARADSASQALADTASQCPAETMNQAPAAQHMHDNPARDLTGLGGSAAGQELQASSQQQQYNSLQQELRALLSLSVQQVVDGAPAAAPEPVNQLKETSRVLYALGKSRTWPGWHAVLGLLQQYSTALQEAGSMLAAASIPGKQGKKQQRQRASAGGASALGLGLSIPALQQAVTTAGAGDDATAAVLSAIRESVPPALWAAGRLLEQQMQQLQRNVARTARSSSGSNSSGGSGRVVQQELLQHQQLWHTLGPVLTSCQQQLHWLGPAQLAQVASGLSGLMHSSSHLLQLSAAAAAAQHQAGAEAANKVGATSDGAATVQGHRHAEQLVGAVAEADGSAEAGLMQVLRAPDLQRLLQQHVGRVESLLPLLALPHRLQLAAAYQQLSLQLPRSVSHVFERDAAARRGFGSSA